MLESRTDEDQIRWVTLDAGRGNALDAELLGELERAFDPRSHPAGPVVLTGRGRSFCTGLDLHASSALDRDALRDLMRRFHRALAAVLLWPGPVVAALQGHALAGGALLAFAAEWRLLVHGDARFGIHGIRLGIVYPEIALEILRWRLARPSMEHALYAGELLGGLAAHGAGLVDELVEPERLVERARLRATVEPHRREAVAGMKRSLQAELAERLAVVREGPMEAWLDRWFDAETTRRREEALRSLSTTGSKAGDRKSRPRERGTT
jgi:enoyl-CoA hydratase